MTCTGNRHSLRRNLCGVVRARTVSLYSFSGLIYRWITAIIRLWGLGPLGLRTRTSETPPFLCESHPVCNENRRGLQQAKYSLTQVYVYMLDMYQSLKA